MAIDRDVLKLKLMTEFSKRDLTLIDPESVCSIPLYVMEKILSGDLSEEKSSDSKEPVLT